GAGGRAVGNRAGAGGRGIHGRDRHRAAARASPGWRARRLQQLGEDADRFSQAILTSDRAPKRACLEVELSGGTVRLSAQVKGAGMISPRFATMFCFVQTDAAMSAETIDLLTGVTVKRSFD